MSTKTEKSDKSPYKKLQCRVAPYEWDRFKELELKGIGVREVFEALCDKCSNMKIYAFNRKTGNEVEIPSNILSKRK